MILENVICENNYSNTTQWCNIFYTTSFTKCVEVAWFSMSKIALVNRNDFDVCFSCYGTSSTYFINFTWPILQNYILDTWKHPKVKIVFHNFLPAFLSDKVFKSEKGIRKVHNFEYRGSIGQVSSNQSIIFNNCFILLLS